MAIMIKVTKTLENGQQLWVNPEYITMMARIEHTELAGSDGNLPLPRKKIECTSLCISGGDLYMVQEHPEEIIRRINWAEAKSLQVVSDLTSSFLEREERMTEEKTNAEMAGGVPNNNPET